MADLSHWDFAENFSGYDAAALILGIEPRESEAEQGRIRVVTERMNIHYLYGFRRVFHEIFGDPLENVHGKNFGKPELESVKMSELHHRYFAFGEETPLSDWLAEKNQSKFDNQEFQRHTIARWLASIGMKSVYRFDQIQAETMQASKGRWPWGSHHTELLGHLEAAAMKFWVNYDPNDATTAPINSDVSSWLVSERNLSQKMAEAIATLLRPDRLRTGPRK